MNDDETKKTQNVPPVALSIKREAEVSGVQHSLGEIIRDQEVRDAGVVETPAPELAPVQISESPLEVGPSSPLPPQPTAAGQNTEPVPSSDKILSFPDSVQALKGENILASPTGRIGIATIVTHQNERSKSKPSEALPKAA